MNSGGFSVNTKRLFPGDNFDVTVTLASQLQEHLVLIARFEGPQTAMPGDRRVIYSGRCHDSTRGTAYLLRGQVPIDAEEGVYFLQAIEVYYNTPWGNEQALVVPWDVSQTGVGFKVERPSVPKAEELPRLVRVE